jgi:hypothetical protein
MSCRLNVAGAGGLRAERADLLRIGSRIAIGLLRNWLLGILLLLRSWSVDWRSRVVLLGLGQGGGSTRVAVKACRTMAVNHDTVDG